MDKHLIHKNSNILVGGKAKLPTANVIEYGEIAINYSKDNETISLKNSANEIVSFKSEKDNDLKYVNVSGDTMTGGLNINSTLNIGSGNTVSGEYAFAQGRLCKAIGHASHAEGNRTTASGVSSHVEGSGCTANGISSHAEGIDTIASGECSHAEGGSTEANGYYSHAEGNRTIAHNNSSHAEGNYTQAIADYSHAEGTTTQANGVSSHAEGSMTNANGEISHAEGNRTIANGEISHAEGSGTTANGDFSHAEGWSTIASDRSSHAEGIQTNASGEGSHAEGSGTIANNLAEHASGTYNLSVSGTNQALSALTKDATATLFSVGNGEYDNRKNAFEVKYNGDVYVSGDTKFGKGLTANTISATTITASTLAGNATSASKLQTPRTITLSGDISGVTTFDGSANVVINNLITPTYAGSSSKGGAATSANKVNSVLTFAAGTFATNTFDGSAAKTVNVPIKTSNLTNDSDFATNADVSANNVYVTAVTGSANGTMTFDRRNETALTFNSKHIHPISEITNLQTTLDSKVNNTTYNTYTAATNTSITNVTNVANSKVAQSDYNVYTAATNTSITNVTNVANSKVSQSDYNTYTASTNTVINGKAPTVHTHTIAQVTDLQTTLDGKAPTVHTHTIAQVTNLQTTLDGKQAVGDYATNTALNNGLATKQAVGDYATNTALNNGLATKANITHTHSEYVLKAGDTMTGNLQVQGTISASTQIYSSDITLKENIDIISESDIDSVRNITPKAYMFKEDSEHRVHYGTIAQEVETTNLSEMVYESIEGIKGVDYISYLVLKCEQLQRDLNKLQDKFDTLSK